MAKLINMNEFKKSRRKNYASDDSNTLVNAVQHLLNLCRQAERAEEELNEQPKATELSKEARQCTIEIKYGEHQGVKGFFTRYTRNDADLCITFVKAYCRSGPTQWVDWETKCRVPWKRLLSGEIFTYETYLSEHLIERIEGCSYQADRVLYYNFDSLDRSAFKIPESQTDGAS